ncbi:ABC transporter permease [Helicobacter kayseriensis]|uniref:ABC transporter permease n=1 Tax=Helicobacter kayseriensis TaxID=2905877 RepID=UPI001E4599F3|nr:ABC transporter permease [Helicobacter kayseriensis]MCE3048484.1 ABC transporter permease [Helicobacter kayseriensis]
MDFISSGFLEAFSLLSGGDAETYDAIYNTLLTSSLSILIATILGLPLGFGLGYFDFWGKRVLSLICNTLLAFPTVVVGLVVYALISSRGPLGGYGLLFSNAGVVIGQTLLALPIVIALSASVVENMDKRLSLTLKSFALTQTQMIQTTLWELRHALLSVVITAYARIVSEIGIAMMIGGNIKWHTRTITTAISLETNKGEFALAIALGIVLVGIALSINLVLFWLKEAQK